MQKKVQIVSDGSLDLSQEITKEHDIEVVPFYVSFDSETYQKEMVELGVRDFYNEMVEHPDVFPKSSMPSVDDFYQGFAASLEQAEKNMEGKKVKVPDEPSSEICDLCGRPMVIKVGKYGKFLACSGFPECRGTKRLVKDTGGVCPKCGKGRMLERKSAKGRIYYGCERYPDCDFMTWDTPVPTKCEKCGSTLFRKGSKLYCAKEGCGFEMPVPKKD